MTMLRGICVGAGYFSTYHLDAWAQLPEVEIVGICDSNLSRAQIRASQYGIEDYSSHLIELMDRHHPDFVDLITPPETHLPLVSQLVDYPLAIICQKPLAPSFAEAQALVDLCELHKIPLMVHENFRFQPWHREIHRLLQLGLLGHRLFSLRFTTRLGDGWGDDAYLARQPYFRTMSRFLIQETGIHFIDTFRYLAGEIVRAQAILRRLNPVIQGEDCALCLFEFASGALGVWDANRYNEPDCADPRYTFGEFLLEGDAGSLRLDGEGRITLHPLGKRPFLHDYSPSRSGFAGDCVLRTQQHFVDCLRTRSLFETSGRDYLRNMQVLEALYTSTMNRCAVDVVPV